MGSLPCKMTKGLQKISATCGNRTNVALPYILQLVKTIKPYCGIMVP